MLSSPDHLNLYMHVDDFQDELLRHLSRDGGGSDWSVDIWFLLLALSEDWIMLAFLPSSGISPVLHDLSKTSSGFLSTHGCIPSRPMDYFVSSLPK